jgi:hypothetical protein
VKWTGTRTRLALATAIVLSLSAVIAITEGGTSGAAGSHRPDAWVKLCGATNTCIVDVWQPWHGENVYNATGNGQKIVGGVEEGNMIRFWILIENDGAAGDTLHVKGCSGTSTFPLLDANTGAWRAYTNKANVTSAFKSGALKFSFPSAATEKEVIVTLTFRADTGTRGLTYSCPVTVSSGAQRAIKDRVVAKMITI